MKVGVYHPDFPQITAGGKNNALGGEFVLTDGVVFGGHRITNEGPIIYL